MRASTAIGLLYASGLSVLDVVGHADIMMAFASECAVELRQSARSCLVGDRDEPDRTLREAEPFRNAVGPGDPSALRLWLPEALLQSLRAREIRVHRESLVALRPGVTWSTELGEDLCHHMTRLGLDLTGLHGSPEFA